MFPLLSKEKTVEDRVKVYSGKNRDRMEVERLRERLIRELREGGSQEGKRQKKKGRNAEHSKGKQRAVNFR